MTLVLRSMGMSMLHTSEDVTSLQRYEKNNKSVPLLQRYVNNKI